MSFRNNVYCHKHKPNLCVCSRAVRIMQTYDKRKEKRLSRQWWPTAEQFKTLNLTEYESYHCAPGILQDEIWKANLPFYERIFPEDQLQEIKEYRDRVAEVADEAAKRKKHYHPEQNGDYWKKTFHKENMFER